MSDSHRSSLSISEYHRRLMESFLLLLLIQLTGWSAGGDFGNSINLLHTVGKWVCSAECWLVEHAAQLPGIRSGIELYDSIGRGLAL